MLNPIQEELSLIRLELMGNLARAARLAMAEFEYAEQVEFHVTAVAGGLSVDCELLVDGRPVSGWGS